MNYRFTEGGEQLACRVTVLIKGKWEYDLTEQTLSDDWTSMESTLHQVVQSFKTFWRQSGPPGPQACSERGSLRETRPPRSTVAGPVRVVDSTQSPAPYHRRRR